jgi:hypothetical protein
VLLPGEPDAYVALASDLVSRDEGAAALPLATNAARLEPQNAGILHTYAATLHSVGRCADALKVEQRARDRLPETAARSLASEVADKVSAYARECGPR